MKLHLHLRIIVFRDRPRDFSRHGTFDLNEATSSLIRWAVVDEPIRRRRASGIRLMMETTQLFHGHPVFPFVDLLDHGLKPNPPIKRSHMIGGDGKRLLTKDGGDGLGDNQRGTLARRSKETPQFTGRNDRGHLRIPFGRSLF